MLFLRRFSALCVLLCLQSVPALADGPARLVADFTPGSDEIGRGFSGATGLGNRMVFLSGDHEYQLGLWATDGTPDGTRLLADLCPPCEPALLGSTGTVAFYRVGQGYPNAQMQIWRTDGTPAGTFPVMIGPGNPLPSSMNGGLLFFTACSAEQGCEVWLSDGTVAGTRPAGEIVPGPGNGDVRQIVSAGGRGDKAFVVSGTSLWAADRSGVRHLLDASKLRSLFADRGRAFFVAEVDGEFEVWTSDGTAAGTRAVTSFGPKNPFGRIPFSRLVEDRFYFAARPGKGNDLWSVGATRESLRRLTDFNTPNANFQSVAKSGKRVLFVAQRPPGSYEPKLWVNTGDARSTAPLSGCPGGCPQAQSDLAPVGQGRFVFKGSNGSGEALWVTDGTGAGTRLLKPTGRYHDLAQYTLLGDRVLFEVTNEYETGELWLSDGTPAGTFFLAPGGPNWSHYWGWGGSLQAARTSRAVLFSGFPDEDAPYQVLLTSDGSPGGLRELGRSEEGRSSFPQRLLALRDRLLVQTCAATPEGSTQELRVVQGTESTVLLSRTQQSSSCGGDPLAYRLAALDDRAAFLLNEYSEGTSLWGTDGTPAGTAVLIPASPTSVTVDVVPFGNRFAAWVFVQTGTAQFGSQLWVSDGTPAGTSKLLDLPAGTEVYSLTGAGGRLYFFDVELIGNNKYRMRPWVSDGTAAGTHPLTAVNGITPDPAFTVEDGGVFFRFTPEGGRAEIWRSDGTTAGTGPFVTAASGMTDPQRMLAAGGRLYFQARRAGSTGTKGPLLPWVSDGTDAGTEVLAEAAFEEPGDIFYQPWEALGFLEAGGRVYFAAIDKAHGEELWATDGTPEGTALVKDIAPGPLSSSPRGMVAWNGRLWFRDRTIPQGMELWTSDGTAEGTRLVQDISEGPSWSTPREPTVAGDSLYFSAHDGEHGRELWVLPAPDVP
ncbi:MAG TPA: ELWxxDGT repeat protein [Thermoanaerobaculia bacterium]|jgi:ELWxxDGT repeat protein|nr:ELWxxDGT repeat protein [Thermoanaerobaculia bacterium]